MTHPSLVPVGRPEVTPRSISSRLRSQLVYFMSARDGAGVPPLGEDEFWFAAGDVRQWLLDGVIYLVSPLDTANMTEIELSEEQEVFLNWLQDNQVEHVRVQS